MLGLGYFGGLVSGVITYFKGLIPFTGILRKGALFQY